MSINKYRNGRIFVNGTEVGDILSWSYDAEDGRHFEAHILDGGESIEITPGGGEVRTPTTREYHAWGVEILMKGVDVYIAIPPTNAFLA